MTQKQNLYQEVKALAQTLNIAPPRWIGSGIVSLQRFIADNIRRPELPFFSEIRSRGQIPSGIIQFRFTGDIAVLNRLTLEPDANYYVTVMLDDSTSLSISTLLTKQMITSGNTHVFNTLNKILNITKNMPFPLVI